MIKGDSTQRTYSKSVHLVFGLHHLNIISHTLRHWQRLLIITRALHERNVPLMKQNCTHFEWSHLIMCSIHNPFSVVNPPCCYSTPTHLLFHLELHPKHGTGAVHLIEWVNLLYHVLKLLIRINSESKHKPPTVFRCLHHHCNTELGVSDLHKPLKTIFIDDWLATPKVKWKTHNFHYVTQRNTLWAALYLQYTFKETHYGQLCDSNICF